jgi:DNA-directed RNA polymerase subunit RPC12/RpoP
MHRGTQMTYICPHCGQDANDPKADLFDSISMGRLTCANCAREFLVVDDVPMTEEQYRQGNRVH